MGHMATAENASVRSANPRFNGLFQQRRSSIMSTIWMELKRRRKFPTTIQRDRRMQDCGIGLGWGKSHTDYGSDYSIHYLKHCPRSAIIPSNTPLYLSRQRLRNDEFSKLGEREKGRL